MAAIGFGNPYTDKRLQNLYFNAPAPQTISAPKRTLGDIVRDGANTVASKVLPKQTARRLADLVDFTPVGAVAQGFDAGTQMRRGDWLGGGLGAALAILPLPGPERLNLPRTPTVDEMLRFGSVENVPLSQARAGNKLEWSKFNSGQYGEPLVKGYADKPLAVQMNNGEYVLLDGNHRAALAKNDGSATMEMHVIPARNYDPANAGLAPAKKPSTEALDALLNELRGL